MLFRLNKQKVSDVARNLKVSNLPVLLTWWYNFTTPVEPPAGATFSQREIALRVRLASSILLFLLVSVAAILFLLILGIIPTDYFFITLVALAIICIAIALNRFGLTVGAGILLVCSIMVGFAWTLLRGQLDVNDLPIYDLLVMAELLAVSFLPPRQVFLVGLANTLFIWGDLTFQAHTPALDTLLNSNGYYVILVRPIALQLVVAVVSYFWVRGANHAFTRASRAEEIAALERTIAEQSQLRLETQHAEQQIIMAYEQQRQVNQFKDQFIMNVSHELRTPLTSISGYLELLKEYRDHIDPTTQTTFLNKASEGCDELTRLVNSVLDAITVSNEIQPALCEIVSVNEVVANIIEHLDPRDTRSYSIVTNIAPSLEVWADQQYMRQVLRNLLSNAFKYSPKNTTITISAKQITPEHIGNDPLVQISIKDEGLGIPTEETALLFEKFVRLKRDLAGSARGTGLGLYITRQLVEAMGGRIWVESAGKPGEGSIFSFTLPCASPLSSPTQKDIQKSALHLNRG